VWTLEKHNQNIVWKCDEHAAAAKLLSYFTYRPCCLPLLLLLLLLLAAAAVA